MTGVCREQAADMGLCMYLGQGTPSEKDREGISAIVVFVQLQDLDCVILQKVVEAVGAPVSVQRLPVVPHTVEAQNLHTYSFLSMHTLL